MAKYKSVSEAVKDITKKKKVKVVANIAGHGWGVGTTIDVVKATANGSHTVHMTDTSNYSYNVRLTDIESLGGERKEDIEANIKKLEAEVVTEKAKLKFIEDTGNAVYDETEFKVFQTLQTLKGKKSDIEKAKIIANLINNN